MFERTQSRIIRVTIAPIGKRILRKSLGVLTAFSLTISQSAPALAVETGASYWGRDDIRAMSYIKLPLGGSQTKNGNRPSLEFSVLREFQATDPLNHAMSGDYRYPHTITVNATHLRFGMDGKLTNFDIGGFNALRTRTLLNAAQGGDEGIPTWAWIALGGAALVVVIGLAVANDQAGEWEGFTF